MPIHFSRGVQRGRIGRSAPTRSRCRRSRDPCPTRVRGPDPVGTACTTVAMAPAGVRRTSCNGCNGVCTRAQEPVQRVQRGLRTCAARCATVATGPACMWSAACNGGRGSCARVQEPWQPLHGPFARARRVLRAVRAVRRALVPGWRAVPEGLRASVRPRTASPPRARSESRNGPEVGAPCLPGETPIFNHGGRGGTRRRAPTARVGRRALASDAPVSGNRVVAAAFGQIPRLPSVYLRVLRGGKPDSSHASACRFAPRALRVETRARTRKTPSEP